LFAGVKVWFSPNLLIADLSLRDELVRRGASVVEQAGNDVNTNTNNNNNIKQTNDFAHCGVVRATRCARRRACETTSSRRCTTCRALIEHDTNASNSPLALPIEWNGNVLASLAMRGIVVCCTGMAPAEKTVGMRLFFCFCEVCVQTMSFFVAAARHCLCARRHRGAHFG
jgi:hypothetical protein